MPDDPHAIIRYLRECYQENGSRGGLWNFFGGSVHNRVFASEVSEGPLFLRSNRAATAAKQAYLYQKERDLWYASIFVVGWVERIEGQPEVICAPVFLCPATLGTEGLEMGATLEVDTGRGQLNAAVLEAIGGPEFFQKIERETHGGELSEGTVGTVRCVFAEAFPEAATDGLLSYPALEKERVLRSAVEQAEADSEAPLTLLSVASIALVNKSTEMRGVLNELERMGETSTLLSTPVRALLTGEDAVLSKKRVGIIPAHLSAAQQRVLDSARGHPLTLAVGPPGTGKSFTIAALAIEAMSQGQSVLIASKMDHAVDVAGDKIESTIGLKGAVVRGGRKSYLKQLKSFLEELLSGLHIGEPVLNRDLRLAGRTLTQHRRQLESDQRILEDRLKREIRWGQKLARDEPNWFQRWQNRRIQKRLESIATAQDFAHDLYREHDRHLQETVAYFELSRRFFLAKSLRKGRASFQAFNRGIRARTGTKQEDYFDDIQWPHLFGALPIWLTNLSDVHKILPMTRNSFDLVILDEASQCDLASALPVLQRGKRAVIAGDPKQLRHLSFLPIQRQAELAKAHGLDALAQTRFNFRDVSLLDAVSESITDQNRVAFLDEHFRSRPEIIAFSNREFYHNQLKIMTGHHATGPSVARALRATYIEKGSRSASGTNRAEADFILSEIATLVRKAPTTLSIGILSPFRNQVDYLKKRVRQDRTVSAWIERHEILIGTAHTFQGEERDAMFISFAVDPDSPSASFRFLEKPDLFNVAITRARQFQHVVHSFPIGHVSSETLLGRYLQDATHGALPAVAKSDASLVGDRFAQEVADFLHAQGAKVTLGYPLAGTQIDLLYRLNGRTRGLDLVGYPGSLAEAFPHERVLTFQRANLEIYPLTFAAWECQRVACEQWLTGNLEQT